MFITIEFILLIITLIIFTIGIFLFQFFKKNYSESVTKFFSILLLLFYLGISMKNITLFEFNSFLNFIIKVYYFYILNINNIKFSNIFFYIHQNFIIIIQSILILITIWIILLNKYLKSNKSSNFEINILLVIVLLSFCAILKSNNLITIYLFIELQSIIFFFLTAFNSYSANSIEASIKYFIFGVIASIFILFGISILFSIFNTLDLDKLAFILIQIQEKQFINFIILFAFVFIFIGILIKLGSFPFHFWVPIVYNSSLTLITAYFITITYIAYSALIINIFLKNIFLFDIFKDLFYYCSLGSVLWGTLQAIYQSKLKKFMAYNSILNVGYILMLILSIFSSTNLSFYYSLTLYLVYILTYTLININFWTIILVAKTNKRISLYLSDLKNLYLNNKVLSYLLIIDLLSMAALPPTVGFVTKFLIFTSAIDAKLKILAFILLMLSPVSIFSYLRVIKMFLFDSRIIKNTKKINTIDTVNFSERLIIITTFLFVIFYPIYFTKLFNFFNFLLLGNLL